MEVQRVVVIQDASREVSSSALRWALPGLSLKPGDKLTLLSVLHQVDNPCRSPFAGSRKLLGYKNKVDSNSILGTNARIVNREAANKEEYGKNEKLVEISRLYEMNKVEFKIEVAAGSSPKVVALKATENLKPTWVILDRQMKKDRKYFLAKLSCGISRMKRNDRIKQLRGPKTVKTIVQPKEEHRSTSGTSREIVPGTPEDLFSIDIRPDAVEADKRRQVQERTNTRSIEESWKEWKPEEMFQDSICDLCKNRRPSDGFQMDLTYEELQVATDCFSMRNFLYEDGLGSVFRGQLRTENLKLLIKQHKIAIPEGEMNFSSEINQLRIARHNNVLKLLGTCKHGSSMLLAYEYACNGLLKQHLSKYCASPLTWKERMEVALGSARGLNYLHNYNIVHRNVSSSSIFLTHDFEPLLGDFGFPSDDKVVDISGYLAPEYTEKNWQFSTATDVYAFGVVLLEIITGQMITDKLPGDKNLVEWARPLLKERRLHEMIDPRVANSHDSEQLYWCGRVIQHCLQKVPGKRLTMDKVVSALECIADRQSSNIVEDISAVKSYLDRSISDINGIQNMGRSFSLTSSYYYYYSSSASNGSTSRTSTSFSRSSTSSIGKSDRLQRGIIRI